MSTNNIQDLFPAPSPLSSKISPGVWPGTKHQSTEALRSILKENHEKWHVFFNDMGFHNHITHTVLALWALGADKDILNASYEKDSSYQLAAFDSPEDITAENFKEHLGDPKYYTAYRKFFTDIVQKQDVSAILEHYIFDVKSNFDSTGGSAKQPEMLTRFLDALIHPMIHVGYGLELGLPGMVVEGLASTAIHKTHASVLVPASLWESSVDSLTSRLPSTLDLENKGSASFKNTHAFTILARILKDSRLEATPLEDKDVTVSYGKFLKRHGEVLRQYADEWSFDSSNPTEVERKIEELVWTNVLIYGIGGWTKGEDFNADFFYMHLVTSSLFLSSIALHLKPASQEKLLRGYFATSIAWYAMHGRPSLDIPGFFAADTAYPTPPGPFPPVHKKAFPSATSPKSTTPNPWFPLVQTSLVFPDEHISKIQRALAHFSQLYGSRAPGRADFVDTELPFAELLDGTLFVRVAGLTSERLTREDNGEGLAWDRKGFHPR